MKNFLIFVFLTLAFALPIAEGYVVLYPGVEFYNDDLTVCFGNTGGVNVSYLEVGDGYVVLGELNLSLSCSGAVRVNVSQANSAGVVARGTSILRFNTTYTGSSIAFTFYSNNSRGIYKLYTDGSLTSSHEAENFSWTKTGWSTHDFDIRVDGYRPDPPYNGNNAYTPANNTVNLTWSRGTGSDREVVVCKIGSYPSSPSDGHVYQNSTDLFYNFTINASSGYFTVWSYNTTSGKYSSTGLNIPWGALTINVFNASKTWQKVSPCGVIIQNTAGSTIYLDTTVTPPLNLNLSDIPIGSNTIFIINASNYKTQSFRRDTTVNTFMNYTFLLPPVETTTPGEGDEDPNTGDPTNQTSSQLYLITLYNAVDQSIQDGLINFSLYDNETDSYYEVGSFITDGAGQGTIWLIPNKLYKVVCSVPGSNDYQTNISYWTPSNLVLTKTFKLKYTEDEPQEPYLPSEYITFTASRTNTTLTIVYNDALEMTIDTTIMIYEVNTSTGVESLFSSNTTSGVNSFTLTVTGLNSSNGYRIVLHYNHTIFGRQDPTVFLPGYRRTMTLPETFNVMMTNIFGFNPLVWSHVVMFIILVIGMFFADPEDAGKVLMIIGGIFIFLNVFIGFDDALTTAAGGIIPGLFILVGLIIEWNNRKV